jgi:hypothetical protein
MRIFITILKAWIELLLFSPIILLGWLWSKIYVFFKLGFGYGIGTEESIDKQLSDLNKAQENINNFGNRFKNESN